jgi:lysophospholipase L1-like esterase
VQDGTITSAKIANGAVTDAKLTQSGGVLEKVDGLKSTITRIGHPADNIFTELVYTQGGGYDASGAWFANSAWGYTDLIPCEGNTRYYLNVPNNQYINFYNGSREYISGIAANNALAPAETAFIRLSVINTRQSQVRLTSGGYYHSKITPISSETNNLFDAYAISPRMYIGPTGVEIFANYYATSDFIPVDGGNDYTLNCAQAYTAVGFSWYDIDKNFIQRDNRGGNTNNSITRTAPNNARYLRVSLTYGIDDTFPLTTDILIANETMIAEGEYIEKYFPHTAANDSIARDLAMQPKATKNVIRKLTSGDFVQGLINTSGTFQTVDTRISSGFFNISGATTLSVLAAIDYRHRCIFFGHTLNFINTPEQQSWHVGWFEYPIPSGAEYCRICVAKTNDSAIEYDADTGCVLKCGSRFVVNRESQLYGKKLSILGDSISTYAGIGNYATASTRATSDGIWTYSGNLCRYPQLNLLQNVCDCYWYKLLQHFTMTLGINESIAGSTVVGSDSAAISSETRIGHLDNNGIPDIILVNAGTNDIGLGVEVGTFNTESPVNYTSEQIAALDCSTFADAYRAMIIRLQYHYPNSLLIVLLPNYTSSYYTPDEADVYNEIVKEVCDYFGVFWIDARTSGITMFNRTNYLPDGIHYNSAGMEMLYQNVKNAIESHFR